MGHRTENVELTVLCLIQDGNKMLLQNRVKEDWKGYTFPGGHVEAGESFVDAVMARRYHEIKGLAEFTAKTIVSDEEQWKKFLHTAGHMYKYPFPILRVTPGGRK